MLILASRVTLCTLMTSTYRATSVEHRPHIVEMLHIVLLACSFVLHLKGRWVIEHNPADQCKSVNGNQHVIWTAPANRRVVLDEGAGVDRAKRGRNSKDIAESIAQNAVLHRNDWKVLWLDSDKVQECSRGFGAMLRRTMFVYAIVPSGTMSISFQG